MSTHNICFCGEIRKILCGYPHLSVAMSGFIQPKIVESFHISPQKQGPVVQSIVT